MPQGTTGRLVVDVAAGAHRGGQGRSDAVDVAVNLGGQSTSASTVNVILLFV